MLNKFMDDKLQTISMNHYDDVSRQSRKKIIPVEQIQQINRKTQTYAKKAINYDDRPTVSQEYLTQNLKARVEELQNQLEYMKNQYQAMIADLNSKSSQKNDFFLKLIQDMQERHAEQINYYQNAIQGYEQEKKQMNSIQAKMNQIGAGIEDILVQSSQLSRTNEQLTEKLNQRQKIIQQLRKELQQNTQNLTEYQRTIDEAQKMKLKSAKKVKDLLQLIDEAQREIQQTKKSFQKKSQRGQSHKQVCPSTKMMKKNCQHCKLSNLSDKYSKMIDQDQ